MNPELRPEISGHPRVTGTGSSTFPAGRFVSTNFTHNYIFQQVLRIEGLDGAVFVLSVRQLVKERVKK